MSHEKVPAGDKTSGDNTHTKRTEDYRKPVGASFPGKAQKSPNSEYDSILLRAANLDGSVLEFEYKGAVRVAAPTGDPVLHDRDVCAGGLKDFVRPATTEEMFIACTEGKICTHILVHEISPGLRLRHFVAEVGEN